MEKRNNKKCLDCVYMTRNNEGLMSCRNASRQYLWQLENPYCTGWERKERKYEHTSAEKSSENLWG